MPCGGLRTSALLLPDRCFGVAMEHLTLYSDNAYASLFIVGLKAQHYAPPHKSVANSCVACI